MCGGAGTRLWPVSRASLPKQFIPLFDQQSSFQKIASILKQDNAFGELIVLTNHEYRFLVSEQLKQVNLTAQIVLEPLRRDSAPAIAIAAELAAASGPDAVAAVMAADHAIGNPETLIQVLKNAANVASAGHIVSLGIEPDHPATGYGYIRKGDAIEGQKEAFAVAEFVEKPNAKTAARYIEQGYVWNSGNFVFPADKMLAELEKFEPEIFHAAALALRSAENDLEFVVLDEKEFSASPQKSIDYAVMERTDRAAVIPASFGWSDIGAWSSVRELSAPDSSGNAVIGDGVAMACENVLIHSPDHLTAAIGLRDIIVVSTSDSVLVVAADHASQVKELVAGLAQNDRREATEHRRTLRPWGYYQSVDEGERHQVKRIVVKPKGKLSLQKHHHRAEHWIVVKGTAEVTVGEVVKQVHENESIYVPMGEIHRLANPGKIDLELIEVQTGSYLGEDDIVRIDDIYNR